MAVELASHRGAGHTKKIQVVSRRFRKPSRTGGQTGTESLSVKNQRQSSELASGLQAPVQVQRKTQQVQAGPVEGQATRPFQAARGPLNPGQPSAWRRKRRRQQTGEEGEPDAARADEEQRRGGRTNLRERGRRPAADVVHGTRRPPTHLPGGCLTAAANGGQAEKVVCGRGRKERPRDAV